MEYYLAGWTVWAVMLAMHAIWWAWIAPNVSTKLKLKDETGWRYIHWLPYLTTLSLIFWPFLALDKIQNWSPTDSKSVLLTIGIFSFKALVIFAFITKYVSCKDCPNLFGDIAAKVSMGFRHKIQKSFMPHGSLFLLANFFGMFALYSFVISPSEAAATGPIQNQEEIRTNFETNYEIAQYNSQYPNSLSLPRNQNIGVNNNISTNNVAPNSQSPITDANGNINLIIGPDGKPIEGEIIAATETSSKPDNRFQKIAQPEINSFQASFVPANQDNTEPNSAPISLAAAYAPTWQLVEASTRFANEDAQTIGPNNAAEFIGGAATEAASQDDF